MLSLDHLGLACRDLGDARTALASHGLEMHEEHGAGWVAVSSGAYIHVLPADPAGSFFRRQIARLLDSDLRWSSWAVTGSLDELKALPVGKSLHGSGTEMTLGSLQYLTSDSGLDGMMESNGALPYATAYFTPGITTRDVVAAMRPPSDGERLVPAVVGVEVAGQRDLTQWVGTDLDLDVRFVEGAPGLHTVELRFGDQVVPLSFGPLRSAPSG